MNAIDFRAIWFSVDGVLWMSAGLARADWPQPPENLQDHVIQLTTEIAKEVSGNLPAAMDGVNPEAGAAPRISATPDKGYLIAGDLFRTGTCFALYEPKVAEKSTTLALAEWKDGKWQLRGLWKIPLTWFSKDERWRGTSEQNVYGDLPPIPFELEDLISDEVPEVILSGEKTKYRQVSYLMKFDKQSRGLELLADSMAKPVKVGKLVRLYDASGSKAIWGEWTFLEWKGGKLVERALWHSETPYNNTDASFYEVRATDTEGTVEEFRVTSGEILKEGKPFATMTATWMPGKEDGNAELLEGAWLFEKLTGLPQGDFPERYGPETEDKPKLERLEDCATVKVEAAEGNEEAKKRFSGKK